MSNETPCSSSSFSSKRKEISMCFDKDNQKLHKLNKTSDIYRSVGDESDSDEEVFSSIKQKLNSDSRIYHQNSNYNEFNLTEIEKCFDNSLIIDKDDGDGNGSDDEGFNIEYSKKTPLIRQNNQNNSTTSKKKVQCSMDSSDEEKSEELDYQSDDEEMAEVKTNRMSSGVWKYFKRLSSEDGNYTVCQIDD
ncbi:hypothetical protein BpHYR1_015406 [Brachionus plicatilis]|uniref:Uncharacterized protein n=1 Tax=Brachionus plicatilis TaxID=10195 RepID=A0A3M7R4Q0_BRAPC|nr:hypothetical protein BpHYR1_015406 [Brachionus plicatilis]